MFERPKSGERALLVRLGIGAHPAPAELSEFEALAVSAGAQPVGLAQPALRVLLGLDWLLVLARRAALVL